MKIGILTQPLLNNYGGLLQNYALQQSLKGSGFEPVTIDHGDKKQSRIKQQLGQFTKYIFHRAFPSKYASPRYQPTKKEFSIISQNSNYFIDKYITRTIPFYSEKELQDLVNKGQYDGYVVGSDQVWRPIYSGGFFKEMFFSFVEGKKNVHRIAYAASFGTDKWELDPQMTEECARLAKSFDVITVREDSGVALCRENLGVEAIHVLDPTMLLSKDDYIQLVDAEKEPKSPGDLFYYILDPSHKKTDFINDVATHNNLVPFTVLPKKQAENRTRYDVKHNIEDCVYPSVTSWLRAFMDAKMVIVDSFHGAVFSIIFNKPFWIIANPERGNARFSSLLKQFGLENRMTDVLHLHEIDINQPIDWDSVNEIKQRKITESTEFFNYLK